MNVSATPNPFIPGSGFNVTASDGVPPYTVVAEESPPNPPGVTIDGMHVDVPTTTPGRTPVYVKVYDSSSPAQEKGCMSRTV